MAVIRAADVADADALGRVHVRAWRFGYAGQLPEKYLRALAIPVRQERWRNRLADTSRPGRILVADIAGRVVGFASTGPSRDADAARGAGELYALYVDPNYWGRGVGRQLHDQAVDAIRACGHRLATLWVLKTNARAQRFYTNAGWEPDEVAKIDVNSDGILLPEVRFRRLLSE